MLDAFFQIDGQYYIFSLLLVSLLTGFVGAIGGPSGLIILPFLVVTGVAPVYALGTARFAAMFPWVIAVAKLKEDGQLRLKEFLYLAVVGVVAGVLGTVLILDANEEYVYPIVGMALLVAGFSSFLKKDFGIVRSEYGRLRNLLGYVCYFLVMLYGGFFGAGASVFALFTLVGFMGFKMLEAHSTHLAVWIVMSVVSCGLFIFNGQVSYYHAFIVMIGMAVGSFVGVRLVVNRGSGWIKAVISLFSVLVGVKLILEYVFLRS